MREIEKEAKELVKLLITHRLPDTEIKLVLMGLFRPMSYPYRYVDNKRVFALYSRDILDLLERNKAIRILKRKPANNGYPLEPEEFIVSYNQKYAESSLYIIKHSAFTWDKRNGLWMYKKNSHLFRRGSGQYKLIDLFMESPNIHFTEEEIIHTYGTTRDAVKNRAANDLIKEIKEPLQIPANHFIAGDGYIFKPTP